MNRFLRALTAPLRSVFSMTAQQELDKQLRLSLANGTGWARFYGRQSTAGKMVTIDTALQLSVVFACISRTAQAVASLPVGVFERQADDSRVRIDDDPIAEVISDSPNADQTALEFWELQTAWLLATGNAYAERVEIGGRLVALQPIPADKCMPVRDENNVLFYRVSDRGRNDMLPRDKIFHLKGFGQGLRDQDLGLSPIALGVNSLGRAMATEEAAATTFANGLRPSGFLTTENVLSPDQRKLARENIIDPLTGSKHAGGVGLLEGGLKFEPVSLNPEDTQMLESRRFDVEDVCRWYGMVPIIIGHSQDGQTMWGSGVEQVVLSWLMLGIDPLCDRIEARIKKQLLRPAGNKRRFAWFDREALLQMDSTAKANFLSSLTQNGLLSRNEARTRYLNQPRRDGADELTAQTNLAPLDQLGGDAGGGNQARAALMAWLGLDQKDRSDEQA